MSNAGEIKRERYICSVPQGLTSNWIDIRLTTVHTISVRISLVTTGTETFHKISPDTLVLSLSLFLSLFISDSTFSSILLVTNTEKLRVLPIVLLRR